MKNSAIREITPVRPPIRRVGRPHCRGRFQPPTGRHVRTRLETLLPGALFREDTLSDRSHWGERGDSEAASLSLPEVPLRLKAVQEFRDHLNPDSPGDRLPAGEARIHRSRVARWAFASNPATSPPICSPASSTVPHRPLSPPPSWTGFVESSARRPRSQIPTRCSSMTATGTPSKRTVRMSLSFRRRWNRSSRWFVSANVTASRLCPAVPEPASPGAACRSAAA